MGMQTLAFSLRASFRKLSLQSKYTTVSRFTQENSGGDRLFEVVDAIINGPPAAAAPAG
jgi:hypothetical protein